MSRSRCPHCGSPHHPGSYHTEKTISAKGYPRNDPHYKSAHEEATKKEKAKFPRKDYNRLKHLDESTPKGTLIGKNTRSGKVDVSTRVPKKLRPEVIFHEKTESRILKRNKK